MKLSDNTPLILFLNELFDANLDFAHSHEEAFFDSFRDDQTPRVTVLTCSDSRVQMQSFDSDPQNDMFAVRNIGNQVSNSEGSIDFGVKILKTPFLLIIGHSGCGAVQAVLSGKSTEIQTIDDELKSLKLTETDYKLAIVQNVHTQVNFATKKYKDLIEGAKLVILGAVYDFKDDFGFGKGKLIAISINGNSDSQSITSELQNKVKNFKFLNLK